MFWPLLLRRDVASGIAGGFTGRQPVTIPMVWFTRLGKIFGGDIPLHHQFSITTQRSFKVSVVNEMPKCF